MLRITQVDHLVLRVVDLRAMMHFYIDVLGCTLEKVQENIGLWQLRAGNALIGQPIFLQHPRMGFKLQAGGG